MWRNHEKYCVKTKRNMWRNHEKYCVKTNRQKETSLLGFLPLPMWTALLWLTILLACRSLKSTSWNILEKILLFRVSSPYVFSSGPWWSLNEEQHLKLNNLEQTTCKDLSLWFIAIFVHHNIHQNYLLQLVCFIKYVLTNWWARSWALDAVPATCMHSIIKHWGQLIYLSFSFASALQSTPVSH